MTSGQKYGRSGVARSGMRILALLGALAGMCFTVPSAQGAARLDPSFGDGGSFRFELDGLSPAFDVAEDRSGRLVVAGEVSSDGAALLRLRRDGSLDRTFGNRNGLAFYPNRIPGADRVAIDSRGRILTLASDELSEYPEAGCMLVTRWPADGALPDWSSFGKSRMRGTSQVCEIRNHGPFAGLDGSDIALTRSDRILVGGRFFKSYARQGGMVARLMPNGGLDRSLPGDRQTRTIRKGVIRLRPGPGEIGSVRAIKPLAGGRILVGGTYDGRFMAALFEQDGRLARTFGRKGVASFDLDGDPDCECSYGTAMVRDYHRRILIAGFIRPGLDESDDQAPRRLRVIRLTPDGRLDRSFGVAGVARPSKVLAADVRAIAVQRDGRIVVAGDFDQRFGLARFNPDGSPDETFFDSGIYAPDVFNGFGTARDVMIDRQGRIVASGGQGDGYLTVLRLLPR